jgi:hypothetical protein
VDKSPLVDFICTPFYLQLAGSAAFIMPQPHSVWMTEVPLKQKPQPHTATLTLSTNVQKTRGHKSWVFF